MRIHDIWKLKIYSPILNIHYSISEAEVDIPAQKET
jgi:hypothetical protein